MTTYNSAKTASTVVTRENTDNTWVWATYEIASALSGNDIVEMVKVPSGATVQELIVSTDILETDGTPAMVVHVGDDGDADRFAVLSAANLAAGGTFFLGNGITGAATADAAHYTYTADNTIDLKVITAADAGGTGTIKLGVCYSMQS